MKKILSAAAAVVLAAALISCGDSGDTYTANADTVLSVGTPVVTGKAYPGVNYITWTPVANANSYDVYRTVGGASEKVASGITALEYADYADPTNSDFALVDGVNYEYTIFAVGANRDNVPSRLVYLATSTAKTTVKATVPAYGTDITAFTDKATKDYLAKIAAKTGVTAPALIDPTTFARSNYNVSLAYPVIPGYKYGVKLVNETKVAAGIEQKKATSFATNFKSTYTAQAYKSAFGAGKYTAYLTVAALSPLYPTTAVYALGEIEIKDIGETSADKTKEVSAVWAGPTSIRVTWTPAKLAKNNDYTPVANYKVYRSSSADNHATLTEITKADLKATKVEQINDTTEVTNDTTVSNGNALDARYVKAVKYLITDNTIKAEENQLIYRYYVVHTDGTNYGSYLEENNEAKVSSVYAAPATEAPTLTFVKDIKKDAKAKGSNTVKLTAKKNAGAPAQTLKLEYIKLEKVNSQVVDVFASTFTALPLSTEIGTANYAGDTGVSTAYLEDAAVGTYLFKLTASETGKSDKSVYLVCTVDPLGAPAWGYNASVTKITSDGSSTPIRGILVQDSYSAAEKVGDFAYTLYQVTTTTKNKQFRDYVEIKTTKVDALELKEVKSDSELYTKYAATVGNYAAVKTGMAETHKTESAADGSITEVYYYVAKTYAGATAASTKVATPSIYGYPY